MESGAKVDWSNKITRDAIVDSGLQDALALLEEVATSLGGRAERSLSQAVGRRLNGI